jgi:hypothetical protein
MSTTNFYVSASADDGQSGNNANTNATLMIAEENNVVQPAQSSSAWMKITPSGLTGEIVTGVQVYWYQHSYSKSKTVTAQFGLRCNGTTIYSYDSSTAPSDGWNSYTLTSGQISTLFNKAALNTFTWYVSDPGSPLYRGLTIRTWDYDGSHTYRGYIVVTHQTGGQQTARVIML